MKQLIQLNVSTDEFLDIFNDKIKELYPEFKIKTIGINYFKNEKKKLEFDGLSIEIIKK